MENILCQSSVHCDISFPSELIPNHHIEHPSSITILSANEMKTPSKTNSDIKTTLKMSLLQSAACKQKDLQKNPLKQCQKRKRSLFHEVEDDDGDNKGSGTTPFMLPMNVKVIKIEPSPKKSDSPTKNVRQLRALLPRPTQNAPLILTSDSNLQFVPSGGPHSVMQFYTGGTESSMGDMTNGNTTAKPEQMSSAESLEALDVRLRQLLPTGYTYKLLEFHADDESNNHLNMTSSTATEAKSSANQSLNNRIDVLPQKSDINGDNSAALQALAVDAFVEIFRQQQELLDQQLQHQPPHNYLMQQDKQFEHQQFEQRQLEHEQLAQHQQQQLEHQQLEHGQLVQQQQQQLEHQEVEHQQLEHRQLVQQQQQQLEHGQLEHQQLVPNQQLEQLQLAQLQQLQQQQILQLPLLQQSTQQCQSIILNQPIKATGFSTDQNTYAQLHLASEARVDDSKLSAIPKTSEEQLSHSNSASTSASLVYSQSESFTASLRINITTADGAKEWLKKFTDVTRCDFTIVRSTKCLDHFRRFKQVRKCHHNVQRGKLGRGKHSACPSRLRLSVDSMPTKTRKGKERDKVFLALLNLTWRHNHAVNAPDVVRHRAVSTETREKLAAMFERGHTPSSALQLLRMDLEMEENSEEKLADRSLCPDIHACFYLYYKTVSATDRNINDLSERLHKLVATLNAKFSECDGQQGGGVYVSVRPEEGSRKWSVAICTPLMRMVHEKIASSAELVYVDSSGGLDSDGYKVYIFSTHADCGVLPLGVTILPSESPSCMTEGFHQLAALFPLNSRAFYGRGISGPVCFMTGDSTVDRCALTTVWPGSEVYLCEFHVMQSLWRWLQHSKNSIGKIDRAQLFVIIKNWIQAQTEDELLQRIERTLQDRLVKKYPQYITHIQSLAEQRHSWARVYRPPLPLRVQHTRNLTEFSMRLIKDKLFERTRAFNIIQMTDFVADRLNRYFERRLLDLSQDILLSLTRLSTFPRRGVEEIVKTAPELYSVGSASMMDVQEVDTLACSCMCAMGQSGKPCKHQFWVAEAEEVDAFAAMDRSPENKDLWYQLATRKTLFVTSQHSTNKMDTKFIINGSVLPGASNAGLVAILPGYSHSTSADMVATLPGSANAGKITVLSNNAASVVPSTNFSSSIAGFFVGGMATLSAGGIYQTSAEQMKSMMHEGQVSQGHNSTEVANQLLTNIKQQIYQVIGAAAVRNPAEFIEPLRNFKDSLSSLHTGTIGALKDFSKSTESNPTGVCARGSRARVNMQISSAVSGVGEKTSATNIILTEF